jgi:1,2-diacylglycerol 3-alpha-glucosyltransferase
VNRGVESFFREAFDGLRGMPNLRLRLLKGVGPETSEERVMWSLPRFNLFAKTLGALTRRNGYVIEQWSSFPCVVGHIREFRPHVVFYSDANLGFLLYRLRRWIGAPFRLLFSNGGPVHPPFCRTDFVHQVVPVYYSEAMKAGEPAEKHFLVPYGIRMISVPMVQSVKERHALRQRLGLPPGRPIVLSVGWISSLHKRMDYVIEEIAKLPRPRPYLQLLGASDESSREIFALGKEVLGTDSFGAHSVSYEDVFNYYRSADCFVLGSLAEGFGRVYLEALMHGLPVIAHDNQVTRYVLGSAGTLGDLGRCGELARLVASELKKTPEPVVMRKRWAHVRDHFSWPVLAANYAEMFQLCA